LSDSFSYPAEIPYLLLQTVGYNINVRCTEKRCSAMRPSQRDKIYKYLTDYYNTNGYPPSMAEIAASLGLKSRSNINAQLAQMANEGKLTKINGKYYPAQAAEQTRVVMVPVLGTIAAGVPITAIENLEGYVGYLPRSGHGGNPLFALRIKGDSMIEAGIYDGDIVIVEQTPYAENGQIVAAMVGDEATVKRFYKENGHYRLQPENSRMEPIIVSEVQILGRVISSMRYYY
jgi:repressor LexA